MSRQQRCLAVAGTVLLALFGSSAPAEQENPQDSGEFEEALAWFEQLGFPDVSGKPFMEVTLRQAGNEGDKVKSVVVHGFLLSAFQGKSSIFTNDLRVIEVDPVANDRRFSVKPAQLAEYATLALRDEYVYDRECDSGFCWEMGPEFGASIRSPLSLTHSAMDFALARACLRNGLAEPSRQLAARAVQHKLRLSAESTRLADQLRLEFCILFTDRAIASMANPSTSRREVLARVEWITKNFPDGEKHREAERMVGILRQMVAEDDARLPREPPDHPPPNTPADLVYYLREQTSWDMTEELFWGYTGSGAGQLPPATRLLALGDEAVPALIDAIGDQRFTRMVVSQMWEAHPRHLTCMPIGRCAYDLLYRIIGEVPKDIGAWPSDLQDIRSAQASWKECWERKKASRPRK